MHRVVVGTCGHVDHGKTTLLKALTGIDCDRLAEEKARGITIDLGFAHLCEGDVQIGFVDVPGHQRFLHNALAGLGGIRIVLMVVAADEGVKPQTREHLAICATLGIPTAVVAVSKCDLVGRERLDVVQLEIAELLAGGPFAAAPLFPVSSHTGAGLAELRAALLRLGREQDTAHAARRSTRLPIDRAFHLRGLGTVVTGTLVGGLVRPGDTLELLPAGVRLRVRSVQVHGQPREEAVAGERTSLQLTGTDLDGLVRGQQLVTPGSLEAGTILCARLTLLADAPSALRRPLPVRFHLYSAEVGARLRPLGRAEIRPGDSGLVEIRLERPVVVVRGDRFIVRRPSPVATLGGGEVLDPAWIRTSPRALAAALQALQGDRSEALALWVDRAGEGGASAEELAYRMGDSPDEARGELDALSEAGRLREAPPGPGHPRRWVAGAVYEAVALGARRILREFFAADPLARGMPKATALRRILPAGAARLTGTYLAWLEADGVLATDSDVVRLPDTESRAVSCVLERFRNSGLTPPGLAELERDLPLPAQTLESVVRHLVRGGKLVRLTNAILVDAVAVSRVRDELQQVGWERFTVPEFKERFGLTRKWAVPLLEHLDATGATERIGNERRVVRV